jgi:hypothetical protein
MREREVYQIFWEAVRQEYRPGESRAIGDVIASRFIADAGEDMATEAVAEFLRT